MVFLGITSTPQSPDSSPLHAENELTPVTLKVRMNHDNVSSWICEGTASETDLEIASIAYEVIEESIDLGFDTRAYLPKNFDPYEVYVDLNAITYIEEDTEETVTASKWLLPEGFDPYGAPEDFMDISYMEEEDLELGFDTRAWLPEGFNAYEKQELDLDTIVYIEEEEIDLGFDTTLYLPENYDPYGL